jgi:hypothetical protein
MPAYPVTTSASVAYPTTQSPAPPIAPPVSPPVAVTSGYSSMPPPGMPPAVAPAAANYRSAYAPSAPAAPPLGAAQNPAAPSPTTWMPAAPGSMPSQYQQPTNTATGPRYERTGSGHY